MRVRLGRHHDGDVEGCSHAARVEDRARVTRSSATFAEGATMRADVCIIGAGPAGIAAALGLADRGRDVLILESGGRESRPECQELNAGEVVGDPYAGLVATRHRAWGGTVRLWNTPVGGEVGAKYVPLSPVDLSGRSSGGLGDWPLEWSDLATWYPAAQELCGLGPFTYDGSDWATPDRPLLDLPTDRLVSGVYQFGPGRVFTDGHRRTLVAADNVRIVERATVCRLSAPDATGRRHRAEAAGPEGHFRVEARAFVLATGAIENARLLMTARDSVSDAPGNGGGWLGRGFMEHPRDRSLVLRGGHERLQRLLRFYDRHVASDGTVVGGRLGIPEPAVADLGNASITLLPRVGPPDWRARWTRRLRRLGVPVPRRNVGGYGWSDRTPGRRGAEGFDLLINLEQTPRVENRVELSDHRDVHGVPLPVLHWRWHPEDDDRLVRLRAWIRTTLEEGGDGEVVQIHAGPPDPNGHHHAGTTRMSTDPEGGVVDPDGCVHGTDDLFVAGASVFPSAGFANPTLTIVAMALRLAGTIDARL